MKKVVSDAKLTGLSLVFVVLFLISSSIAAAIYAENVTLRCKDQICHRNQTAEWIITLDNEKEDVLKIEAVEVSDAVFKKILASFSGITAELGAGDRTTFYMNGELPESNSNGNLTFNICFNITLPDTTKYSTEAADRNFRSRKGLYQQSCDSTNYSEIVIDCYGDDECLDSQRCTDFYCKNINCTGCQYVQGHQCEDYECCTSDVCKIDEICTDHLCSALNCTEGEYIINRTCTKSPCLNGSVYFNYSCLPQNCRQDEFYSNFSCNQIFCNETQFASDHTCNDLNCTFNQTIWNHSCIILNCRNDEFTVENRCEKLDCFFLEKIGVHKCVMNWILILEIFLFFVIIALLYLDYDRYESKHRKYLVKIFLKQAKERNKATKKAATQTKPDQTQKKAQEEKPFAKPEGTNSEKEKPLANIKTEDKSTETKVAEKNTAAKASVKEQQPPQDNKDPDQKPNQEATTQKNNIEEKK